MKKKINNLQKEAFAIVMENGKIATFIIKWGEDDILLAGIFVKREHAERWLTKIANKLKKEYKDAIFYIVKVTVNYNAQPKPPKP